jgi:DNA repair exonuclease SbcCD ATPase subunit
MSFDYDKVKKKQDSGNQWASYSDLFMVLSVVFLLLYVTASLRTGTHTLQQQMQNQKLTNKAQDLENQIKVYNNLKQNYLEKQASMSEQKVYEQLMDKIKLLKDDNLKEASKLRAKADENEKKEAALNQYQQIVRNIINANVLSKARIKRKEKIVANQKSTIKKQVNTISDRDETIVDKSRKIASLDAEVTEKLEVIQKKDQLIAEKQEILKQKQSTIYKLNKDIKSKEKQISKNLTKIDGINSQLNKRIRKLQQLRKNHKLSKKLYNIELKRIQKKSANKISKLNEKNETINKKLETVSTKVEMANKQLQKASAVIASQESQKKKLDQEIEQMQSKVEQTQAEFKQKKQEFKTQLTDLEIQKNKIESQKDQLQNQKDSLEKQKAKLESQKSQMAEINKQLEKVNTQLSQDKNQLSSVQKKLKQDQMRLQKQKLSLDKENAALSKDLKAAKEIINAKRKLAKQISENFSKNGIKAEVNGKTGEVVLSFGKNFFDLGSSELKKTMRGTLNKFMPIYADSIFKDEAVAKKIKSVDIIGFASPTYRGKYVNPNSLDPKDKKAIEYNTNLSIERAKAVFKHIIDTRKLKYSQQNKITPLLKVSGRSYFSGANGRAPAKEMSRQEFCSKYDCKKEQRVIIKFELDN